MVTNRHLVPGRLLTVGSATVAAQDQLNGGKHIHTFVFIDCNNNRFQKKLNNDAQNEYMNM